MLGTAPTWRADTVDGTLSVQFFPFTFDRISFMQSPSTRPKRAGRKPRIPPPPLPPDQFVTLPEHESALGLVLWRTLRNIYIWSTEPEPKRRRDLFRPPNDLVRDRFAAARSEVSELAPALEVFAVLLESPERLSEEQLAEACLAVHAWANERDNRLTAWCYAEAAAYAHPRSAALANLAARSARAVFRQDRAAIWHYRAFRLSAGTRDTKECVWALLGYGTIMKEAGRFEEARRYFERAGRRAVRSGQAKEAAMSHHDLLSVATELGRFRLAEKQARSALPLYTIKHPRIPAFGHDYAYTLIRQRQFSPACTILDAVVPLVNHPAARAMVWSSLAWAAAGAARSSRFREAERGALQLVALHDTYAPAVFIHLAEGARLLGEWETAERYAGGAADAGRRRKDPTLEQEAEGLREEIVQRAPPPREVPAPPETHAFVAKLLSRLARWSSAPGRGRPGADPPAI